MYNDYNGSTKMEYHIETFSIDDLKEPLNRIGSHGWELVSIDWNFGIGKVKAVFKRPTGTLV